MTDNKKSWFKQFWPWFLIALPMVAVVGSINLFITAVDNKPDMVVDDYYAKGKAINNDFALLKEAKKQNISASITQHNKELLIDLQGVADKSSISFSLYHATLAKRDITQMLTADASGRYHFESDQDLTGKWKLRIEPFDKSWRLQKTVNLPTATINL
ncbi:FixH family protein [Psychromonas hadalis]|uniref:FixH family protein n=1 Tax=Psychromonas hadalis TaxID=211669 RepID=UPI0003B787CC|nr:FixH family protein [Psychromonas hadalis]